MFKYLILFCFIVIASAEFINKNSIIINENEQIKDLYVKSNSKFTIYLKLIEDSSYYWALDNFEEIIKNSDIEPLNLVSTYDDNKDWSYDDEANKGEPILLPDINLGFYKFEFKINKNSTLENLPQLNFVRKFKLKDSKRDEFHTLVNLLADHDTFNANKDIKLYPKKEDNKNIKHILEIDDNKAYCIVLTYEVTSDYNNLYYSWYLDNIEQINENNLLDIYSNSQIELSNDNKIKITDRYTFKINKDKFSEKDLLPVLSFTLKESPDQYFDYFEKSITFKLRRKSEGYVSFKYEDEKKIFFTEKNEVIAVEFSGNPGAGYGWYLKNLDEVKASNVIEPLNIDDEYNSVPFIPEYSIPSSSGSYIFKFRIKDTVEPGCKLQPPLRFIEARSNKNGNLLSDVELSLIVKKERKEEDLNNLSLPVINIEDQYDNTIYVESNHILKITVGDNSSTGYQWIILNEDDIRRSDYIDFIGSNYESHCQPNKYGEFPTGCGGSLTFHYRIWEVTEEDVLPNIKMAYVRPWEVINPLPSLDFQLIAKSSSNSTECSFNGYKCCSNINAEVQYHDKDGDWSIENNEWCIIKKDEKNEKEKEEEEENTPKLIRTCKAEEIGYSCCKKQKEVIYTDDLGEWGIENGDWCGISTCVYTGDYPVCKTTSEIVFTDTEK